MKPLRLTGRGPGPKGAGQEKEGWCGVGGVCVFGRFFGFLGKGALLIGVCDLAGASMREKYLNGTGRSQRSDAMAVQLLFWELENHLKR